MNLKKEFNRLSGLFGDSVDKVQNFTDDFGEKLRDETDALTRRARRGYMQGRDSLISTEELMARHLKENSTLYLIAGMTLLGLFILRMWTSYRMPMRREW